MIHSTEAATARATYSTSGRVMKKGDFTGGIEVRPLGGGPVMTLGGDPDHWVCTWLQNGQIMTQTFQPEQLERAD
jgi:hypothetical protein